MIVKIIQIGTFNNTNWCKFDAFINEFYSISGIANYRDLELEENTTYKDLCLNQRVVKAQNGSRVVVYNIFKNK